MEISGRVRNYFNLTAEHFDALYDGSFLNRVLRKGLYQRAVVAAAACRDIPRPTVLDVGCGSGRNLLFLSSAGVSNMVGIDYAENMIVLARKRCQACGLKNVDIILGDVTTYPFEEKFDVVVALGVFDYLEDPASFLWRLKELSRHSVVFSAPGVSLVRMHVRKFRYWLKNCPVRFYKRRELEALCMNALFDRFKLVPVSGGFVVVGEQELGK